MIATDLASRGLDTTTVNINFLSHKVMEWLHYSKKSYTGKCLTKCNNFIRQNKVNIFKMLVILLEIFFSNFHQFKGNFVEDIFKFKHVIYNWRKN